MIMNGAERTSLRCCVRAENADGCAELATAWAMVCLKNRNSDVGSIKLRLTVTYIGHNIITID